MKGIKEPASMSRIHEIREEIHAETEMMSIHDMLTHVDKEAESLKNKYNLKLRPLKQRPYAVSA